jgi:hypothetical protein
VLSGSQHALCIPAQAEVLLNDCVVDINHLPGSQVPAEESAVFVEQTTAMLVNRKFPDGLRPLVTPNLLCVDLIHLKSASPTDEQRKVCTQEERGRFPRKALCRFQLALQSALICCFSNRNDGLNCTSVRRKDCVCGVITGLASLPLEWLTRPNWHITPYKFIRVPHSSLVDFLLLSTKKLPIFRS